MKNPGFKYVFDTVALESDSNKVTNNKSNAAKELRVQKYYDRNTSRFLKLGQTGGLKSIHQPLYFDATDDLKTALEIHYEMVLDDLQSPKNKTQIVADLGCGVGDAVVYMARKTGSNTLFYGLTLSREQAKYAQNWVHNEGLADRVNIVEGSYQRLSKHVPEVHVAFAIESLIHSPDLDVTFKEISKTLKPGGKLHIFDDFLTDSTLERYDRLVINRFRNGWQANSLYTTSEITQLAKTHGLKVRVMADFSGNLRLFRPRDRMVQIIEPLARLASNYSIYARFLVGGNARQVAYARGLLKYCHIVLQAVR